MRPSVPTWPQHLELIWSWVPEAFSGSPMFVQGLNGLGNLCFSQSWTRGASAGTEPGTHRCCPKQQHNWILKGSTSKSGNSIKIQDRGKECKWDLEYTEITGRLVCWNRARVHFCMSMGRTVQGPGRTMMWMTQKSLSRSRDNMLIAHWHIFKNFVLV